MVWAKIIGAVSSHVKSLLSVIGDRLFILKSVMSIYEACEALIHMFEGGKVFLVSLKMLVACMIGYM